MKLTPDQHKKNELKMSQIALVQPAWWIFKVFNFFSKFWWLFALVVYITMFTLQWNAKELKNNMILFSYSGDPKTVHPIFGNTWISGKSDNSSHIHVIDRTIWISGNLTDFALTNNMIQLVNFYTWTRTIKIMFHASLLHKLER